MHITQHFNRFVELEQINDLNASVSMGEFEGVLKWFKRDKSHGPHGWPIEFFIQFFELMANDLLIMIKDSRVRGRIYDGFNTTFTVLIPKSDNPPSFQEYRPISLCNCIYKIISKIISNCIKTFLCTHIEKEQFAFLHHRQIHEAIGTSQEALHSIKTKRLKSTILKIDLTKTFEQVNWSYLHLILIHTGFPLSFINWIMGCICHAIFSIILNGIASDFFHTGQGLHQGCLLSPLLFVMVMEGLSVLIKNAKTQGLLHGLQISDLLHLTHLLFLDDVLIFLNGSRQDVVQFEFLLKFFCRATGKVPNALKSSIIMTGCSGLE